MDWAEKVGLRKVKPVYLNKDGKQIGSLVEDNQGTTYYMSPRRPAHYFIKFNGFGIDKALMRWLLNERIIHILIRYDGKKGRKWLHSIIDDWVMDGQVYGTAKEVEDETQTYGEQIILAEDKMKVLGESKLVQRGLFDD